MEIRHLRYFLAVSATGGFTQAAARLHVTQPTLSHQIKQLEAMIGAVLFERSTKETKLTAAGRLFKPYCERVIKEIESSKLAISELEGLMRGTLRMGVLYSFSHSMLPAVLCEFALRYPGVQVMARLVPRVDMERDLLDGELDFAIAYLSGQDEPFVVDRLFEEELVLVVGAKHQLSARKSMPMSDLAKLQLVLLTQEFGARQFVDRFVRETGSQLQIVLEMNAIEPIMATLRDSRLASVLSAGAVVDASGLHVVRLTDPVPKRSVGIFWRRNGFRSAAAVRMAEMIRETYRDTSRMAGQQSTNGGQKPKAGRMR